MRCRWEISATRASSPTSRRLSSAAATSATAPGSLARLPAAELALGLRRPRAARAACALHRRGLRRGRHLDLRPADRVGDEEGNVSMSRILIVEDDDDLVNLATHWLERAGYTVEHAGDGAAALTLLKNDPLPGLVLLDVMLPKIDGFELLRLVRSNPRTKELPVIMVTSFSRDKDAKRGRELGANDYIVKPLMELDFLKRVEHIVKDQ